MNLIVNTTTDTSVTDNLKNLLKDRSGEYDIIEAGDMNISPCIGCNHCWLKTPGECSLKDDYVPILQKAVHAEQLWVISDTALGFINHKGKNIIDRIIPLATMYLHFVNKEMRHVPRYEKSPDIGIIYRGDADSGFLAHWCDRTALNLRSRSLGVYESHDVKEAAKCM